MHRGPRAQAETATSVCFILSGCMLLAASILAAVGIGIPYWVKLVPRNNNVNNVDRYVLVGMYNMGFGFKEPYPNCQTNVMIGDLGCHVTPYDIDYGNSTSNWTQIPVKNCWAYCRDGNLEVLGAVSTSNWLQQVAEAGQRNGKASDGTSLPTRCKNFGTPRALIIAALSIAFAASCFALIAAKVLMVGVFAWFLSLSSFVIMLVGFIMATIAAKQPCDDLDAMYNTSWGASFILVIIAVILAFCATCTLKMGLISCGVSRMSSQTVHDGPARMDAVEARGRDGTRIETHTVTAPAHHMQEV